MVTKSKKLCVHVSEGEKQIVSVKLPSAAIGWMETLMPKHVLSKINQRGIDLAAIKKQAKERGLVSQQLFEMDSGKRTYRVWLE